MSWFLFFLEEIASLYAKPAVVHEKTYISSFIQKARISNVYIYCTLSTFVSVNG